MKTMEYDGRKFWQLTPNSAVRPQRPGRLEILTWVDGGEIQYKTRTVKEKLYIAVEFAMRGIA